VDRSENLGKNGGLSGGPLEHSLLKWPMKSLITLQSDVDQENSFPSEDESKGTSKVNEGSRFENFRGDGFEVEWWSEHFVAFAILGILRSTTVEPCASSAFCLPTTWPPPMSSMFVLEF
jgi:hypothetical protein